MQTRSGVTMASLAFVTAMAVAIGGAMAAPGGGGGGGGGGGSSGGGSSSGGGGGGSSGGGSSASGSGGSSNNGVIPIICREGFVFSEEEKICVRQTSMNDDGLYEQGRALALAGHYELALDVLGSIRDKDDAMVLTMIGYATRKLGHVEEGIAIYHQALAIDPNNLNTREYLGEGYLSAGRVDLAEVQLTTLERLCGSDCDQFKTLERAIYGDGTWN